MKPTLLGVMLACSARILSDVAPFSSSLSLWLSNKAEHHYSHQLFTFTPGFIFVVCSVGVSDGVWWAAGLKILCGILGNILYCIDLQKHHNPLLFLIHCIGKQSDKGNYCGQCESKLSPLLTISWGSIIIPAHIIEKNVVLKKGKHLAGMDKGVSRALLCRLGDLGLFLCCIFASSPWKINSSGSCFYSYQHENRLFNCCSI